MEPHFWPSSCISWVFQTLFGKLAYFLILGPIWGPEAEKSDFSLIFANFSNLGFQKGPKIKKLAKFPNNVWKTHEMQQLGQKWGSKSYLEPNKNSSINNYSDLYNKYHSSSITTTSQKSITCLHPPTWWTKKRKAYTRSTQLLLMW